MLSTKLTWSSPKSNESSYLKMAILNNNRTTRKLLSIRLVGSNICEIALKILKACHYKEGSRTCIHRCREVTKKVSIRLWLGTQEVISSINSTTSITVMTFRPISIVLIARRAKILTMALWCNSSSSSSIINRICITRTSTCPKWYLLSSSVVAATDTMSTMTLQRWTGLVFSDNNLTQEWAAPTTTEWQLQTQLIITRSIIIMALATLEIISSAAHPNMKLYLRMVKILKRWACSMQVMV